LNALAKTFDYLSTAENEAATPLLLAALEHRDRAVADGALQALLRRQSPEALSELVRRWPVLNDRWKQWIAQRPGALTDALKSAFRSSQDELLRNSAMAAVELADYDLFALFAQSTSDASPLKQRLACEALLKLAEINYDELHGRIGLASHRDPQCLRDYLVGNLEGPVTRFNEHCFREVLEAFLLLAPRESATLRHLLQDSSEPAHEPLCEQLLRSTRPGVIRLLLSLIDDPHAPLAALRIIGRRRDVGFFRQLCKRLLDDHSPHLDANLARIDGLSWLQDEQLSLLDSLSDTEQPGVVALAVRTRIAAQDRIRILQRVLHQGWPSGRQAAARALLDARDEQASLLIRELIADPCPPVQAEAARRLRSFDVPHCVTILIELLDSPHAEVQAAAREALDEFSLARYLKAIDTLSDEARRSGGELVKRVHPDVATDLAAELAIPERGRRLRALQAVAALELAPALVDSLCKLCTDESPAVRSEALRQLAQCDGPHARSALRELLADGNVGIQQEAERALQLLADRGQGEFRSPQHVEAAL
jgi:HEAT repeat protein